MPDNSVSEHVARQNDRRIDDALEAFRRRIAEVLQEGDRGTVSVTLHAADGRIQKREIHHTEYQRLDN